MLRIKLKWKLLFLSLLILAVGFTHFYAPRFITEIDNPLIGLFRKTPAKVSDFELSSTFQGKFFTYTSSDGFELQAQLTYASTDSIKGTIILVHGIRSSKEHFVDLSQDLSSLGFNAVAVDLRAHGASEGVHCTFGFKEKHDIKLLIDHLLIQEQLHEHVGIWGQSLGGAVSFQAMALDSRIKFGVIESTFSNLDQVVQDYSRYYLGFNLKPLTKYLLSRAGNIAGFNPKQIHLPTIGKQINQPVIMVHGTEDQRIAINHARLNFDSIQSIDKSLLEIQGAGHLNVWQTGGQDYINRIFDFITDNQNL